MQTYTSKATSINGRKLPAVFRKVKQFDSGIVLDYGCGRYTDHIKSHLAGIHYLPFDPFNQPDSVNTATTEAVRNAINSGKAVDVVCSNVLNVIDDGETIRKIASHIETIVTETAGTGYITVYDGDRSGIGRKTGPDQYQRNEPIRNYLQYFRNAVIKNNMIIVNAKSH